MARVDYDVEAERYQAGRQLSPDDLSEWRDAIARFGPAGSGPILDLGAGTGIWMHAFTRWFPNAVVGVEPSSGMRRVAAATGIGPNSFMLAGRGEAIPLGRPNVLDGVALDGGPPLGRSAHMCSRVAPRARRRSARTDPQLIPVPPRRDHAVPLLRRGPPAGEHFSYGRTGRRRFCDRRVRHGGPDPCPRADASEPRGASRLGDSDAEDRLGSRTANGRRVRTRACLRSISPSQLVKGPSPWDSTFWFWADEVPNGVDVCARASCPPPCARLDSPTLAREIGDKGTDPCTKRRFLLTRPLLRACVRPACTKRRFLLPRYRQGRTSTPCGSRPQ